MRDEAQPQPDLRFCGRSRQGRLRGYHGFEQRQRYRRTQAAGSGVIERTDFADHDKIARLLAGYENYFTAFVAAAREPERAEQLLPVGMTGDALARMLEIRRLDANEGLFWDGTRKDIVSGPRVEAIGETTATLRDCRSVGGVLRKKANGQVVAGTTEPDVDDMRVTFVRIADKWVVTATERFNDVEGRSRCVPGSPSP